MWFNDIEIVWSEWTIQHIAKHHVEPYEVEEGLFEDSAVVLERQKDRRSVLCETWGSRLILVVISYPPEGDQIRIITARDMTESEKRYFKTRQKR
jgi:uncharacterized DUF497 family protein